MELSTDVLARLKADYLAAAEAWKAEFGTTEQEAPSTIASRIGAHFISALRLAAASK